MNDANDRNKQILDLAAQRRREKELVDVDLSKTLLVIFGLKSQGGGQGLYGLLADNVEAIVPYQGATFVPGTPAWIPGVVNVRGEIESVLDLKAVLGLGRGEATPQSRLLIAHEGGLRSGLLVDEMVDIVEVSSAAISPPPTPQEGGKGTYIAGEAGYGDGTLVVLDLVELFHRALETDRV